MAKKAVRWMQGHQNGPFFLNYWMFSVHGPFDAKAELIEKYRKLVDPGQPQHNPIFAAMIESMDDAIGTLLDAIDDLGIADDTFIIFTSDNSGNTYNEVEGSTPTSYLWCRPTNYFNETFAVEVDFPVVSARQLV